MGNYSSHSDDDDSGGGCFFLNIEVYYHYIELFYS
uniref:Uncharacterized protein n=1 Tax=Heterorhabditis bacteriophora TaxID=37862 RepID=A0A1I7WZ75_HETBA